MPTVNDLVALGNHSYTPNLRNGDAGPAGAVVIVSHPVVYER